MWFSPYNKIFGKLDEYKDDGMNYPHNKPILNNAYEAYWIDFDELKRIGTKLLN